MTALPLDSVAGMEAYRDYVRPIETVVVSTLATAGTIVGGALLAVAIFGSCPTVYADSAGTRRGLALSARAGAHSLARAAHCHIPIIVARLKGRPSRRACRTICPR